MNIAELSKILKENKVFFGVKRCIKELGKGRIEQIIFSTDLPADTKKEIEILAGKTKNKVEILESEKTKEEIAEICKKPFNISVICVQKK